MYLSKYAAQAIEQSIDNDIAQAGNAIAGAMPNTAMGRLLMAAPIIAGMYQQRNDRPLEGAAKGLGASIGGYAGHKGGKILADQLEQLQAIKNLTPEQQSLLRLAVRAAGTGLGAKLGWDGVGALI